MQKIVDTKAVRWTDCGVTVFAQRLDSLLGDGLHPNPEGAEAHARHLLPQLRQLYALPPVVE
jgi:lysophospholipase L1-like esterase